MLITSLILAISSSIDSLGIGITYGIKNTKISFIGKIVLFVISFLSSLLSIWFGDIIKNIFSDFIAKLLGNMLLICMGFFICFQAIQKFSSPKVIYKNNNLFLEITIKIIKNPNSSDLDLSNSIDFKEAFFLGFALSLDCLCIGIGGSIIGINSIFFPLFISTFQFIFLSLGNIIGKKLNQLSTLPDNIWSIISGTLLILIGIIKFI